MANMLTKEGLTLKELEAQVGELLPKRLEMRHRRRSIRVTNSCNATATGAASSAVVFCIGR
jgi:hypothetical protein